MRNRGDNLTFHPVPEPSTLVLLSVRLGLLLRGGAVGELHK